jgi:MSHA biogenesis protein MshL
MILIPTCRRVAVSFAIGVPMLVACHPTTAPRPVTTTVRVDPLPAASPAGRSDAAPAAATLPAQPTGAPRLADAPGARVNLDAPPGSPISDVVRQLGTRFGLNVSIDSDVRGTTSVRLQGATLDEALQEVMRGTAYGYTLQGTTLRVTPVRMETRIFELGYVAIARVGTSSTVIQRRLGATSGGFTQPSPGTATGLSLSSAGAGSGGIPGGDVISSTSVADLWQEVRVALVGLLSRAQPSAAPPAGTAPSAATTSLTSVIGGPQQAGLTTGAFSLSWPDGSALTISPLSGLITVTATPVRLAEVQTYLDAFQSSVLRQVLIEAKIVEVQLTRSFQQGIDWSIVTKSGTKFGVTLSSDSTAISSGGAGGVTFTFSGGNTQVNAVLKALETQGDVNVLSQPRTVALNNQRATFDVTTDEVFFATTRQPVLGPNGGVIGFNDQIQSQQISVGIVLDVLPQISSENVVTMNIRPVITSVDRFETFQAADGSAARFPILSRREGDTMLRARNSETVVMGGLMQTQHSHDVSGIPLLKDLPLLGRLFRHTVDTEKKIELVVFLTPTVLAGVPGAAR